jgi:heat shock protein HtpX
LLPGPWRPTVGYLIGSGALIAFIIAAATNLFSYWNADKLVLSMHDAQEVDERSAPELVAIVRELAQHAGIPMPRVYVMDRPQFALRRGSSTRSVATTLSLSSTRCPAVGWTTYSPPTHRR